jgi:hypothetical protein
MGDPETKQIGRFPGTYTGSRAPDTHNNSTLVAEDESGRGDGEQNGCGFMAVLPPLLVPI